MLKFNRSIKIAAGNLVLTTAFSEKHLSKAAIKAGTLSRDKKHYEWVWAENAAVVFYEIPSVFGIENFLDIARELSMYCTQYLEDAGVTDENMVRRFVANKKKVL